MKLKELRSKKYVALIMMIVIIGAIVGILKIGNMDFDKGKVKVSKAVINNVTSSLSANINEAAVDNLITSKGYDEIDYVIKYSLSTDENIKERDVIIEASLDDNEKYASFKDITNGDVTSTISENRKNIKITVKNAKVNKENELKLVMKLEGAPNGYKVTPKIKIKEVSEEKYTNLNVQNVEVKNNSLTGNVQDEQSMNVSNIELALKKDGETIKKTYTDEDGNYVFSDIEEGEYDLEIDEDIYEKVNEEKVNISGSSKLNIIVKEVEPYKIELKKQITEMTIVNGGKTTTYKYGNLDKVQQALRNVKNMTGEVKYKITVQNTGKKSGIVTVVKDEVPEGLTFNKEKNTSWEEKNGVLYNRSLEGITLNAGEKREEGLTLDIESTSEAKTYINKVTAKGEIYENIVYILDGKTYKEDTVLEGEKIKEPKVNNKNFKGWYTDKKYTNKYNFNNEVTKDLVLYGQTEEIKEYTVTYVDNEKIVKTEKVKENGSLNAPKVSKEGHTFKYWSEEPNGKEYDLNTKVTKDITLYSVYDINKYTVTFINGKEKYDEQQVEYGGNIKIPTSPSKEYYTFKYWSLEENGDSYDLSTKVTKDITLYSVYDINKYTVTFIDKGKEIDKQELEAGSLVIAPKVSMEGYTFKYWSEKENGKEYNLNLPITRNLTLYSVYEINKYNVEFYDNDKLIKTIKVDYDNTINSNEVPTVSKIGYTFTGWTENNKNFDFTTKIKENKKLYSKYEIIKNAVMFNDENRITTKKVDYNNKVEKIESQGKTGYTFKYWSLTQDGEEFDFNTLITESITLYAVYNINEYNVNFIDEGNVYGDTQKVKYNNVAVKPETDPTKEGYTFKYWSLEENGTAYDFNTKITKDITLYSVYSVNNYKVSFVDNGTKYIEDETIEYNKVAVKPETDPIKEGYTFKYWSLEENGTAYDFNTKITKDITLYSVYSVNNYKVSFIDNGTKYIEDETIEYNKVAIKPETDPSKEGHTFKYWSLEENGTAYDFSTKITKDTTLYSVYEANEYTVKFMDGDNLFKQEQVKYGLKVNKPSENPTKEHNLFKTWTLNDKEYDFNLPVTDNLVLHSSYEEIEKPSIRHVPTEWTNNKVTVTITSSHEDYKYLYKIDTGEYKEYTGPFDIDYNCTVVAKSVKENVDSITESHDITNIDKIKPIINSLNETNVSGTSFDINASTIDNESGMKQIHIYKDDLLETTIVYNENYNEEKNSTYTFNDLISGNDYKIKVIAEDVAGNLSDAKEITITTELKIVARIIGRENKLFEDENLYENFSSLEKAIKACPSNQCTIEMVTDTKESVEVLEGQDITLEINGKTITGVKDTYTINNGGNLIIKDNAEEAGSIVNDTGVALKNETTGVLTLGELEEELVVSTTKPYINGGTFGVVNEYIDTNTKGRFNFYDGMIAGNVAIEGEVNDKPYLYNASVVTSDNRQVATLKILEDAEARIIRTGVYYTDINNAINDTYSGTSTENYTNTTLLQGFKTIGNNGFIYDEENKILTSSDSNNSKAYTIIDLTGYENNQQFLLTGYKTNINSSASVIIKENNSKGEILTSKSNNKIETGASRTIIYNLEKGKKYYVELSFSKSDASDINMFVITNISLQKINSYEVNENTEFQTITSTYGFEYDEDTKTLRSNNQYTNSSIAFSYFEVDLTNENEDKEVIINASLDTLYYNNYGNVIINEDNKKYSSYQSDALVNMNINSSDTTFIGPYNYTKILTHGKKYYIQFYYFKNNDSNSKEDYDNSNSKDQFIINSIDIVSVKNVDKVFDLSKDIITDGENGFTNIDSNYIYAGDTSVTPAHSYIKVDLTNETDYKTFALRASSYQQNFYAVINDSADMPENIDAFMDANNNSISSSDYYYGLLIPGKINYIHFVSKDSSYYTYLYEAKILNEMNIDLSTNLKTNNVGFTDYYSSYNAYTVSSASSKNMYDSYVKVDLTNSITDKLIDINAYLSSSSSIINYMYITNNSKNVEPNYLNSIYSKNLLSFSYKYSNYSIEGSSVYYDFHNYKYVLPKGSVYYIHYSAYNDSTSSNSYPSYIKSIKLVPIIDNELKIGMLPHMNGTIDKNSDSSSKDYITDDGTSDANFRFIGKDAKNYVKFNNELWRVLGIFNTTDSYGNFSKRIKIIRNESIGTSISWDSSLPTVNQGYGVNEWSNSAMMKLLNEGYDENKVIDSSGNENLLNNSLYWNRKSGYCLAAPNNNRNNCDFTSIGLNTTAKSMIDSVVWNTGALPSNMNSLTPKELYTYERGDKNGKTDFDSSNYPTVDSVERTTTWTGKVALPYASDYIMASSDGSSNNREQCMNSPSNVYGDCSSNNNWMNVGISTPLVSLSPVYGAADPSYTSYTIVTPGSMPAAVNNYTIKPSVYLNPKTRVKSGSGTNNDPFILELGEKDNTTLYYGLVPELLDKVEEEETQITDSLETNDYALLKNEKIYGFSFDNSTGVFTNDNKGIPYSKAISYIKIDLTDKNYDIPINIKYDISKSDYSSAAYINLFKGNLKQIDYDNSNSYNENSFYTDNILYTDSRKVSSNITKTLEKGNIYYLQFAYYKKVNTSVSEDNKDSFDISISYTEDKDITEEYTRYDGVTVTLNKEPDTVQALKDISLVNSINIENTKSMILDLNGHTITTTANDYVLKNSGDLTIIDGKYQNEINEAQNVYDKEYENNILKYNEKNDSYTLDDYIKDGLEMNLDGIQHGEDSSVWIDSSGKGNNGTINGSASFENNYLYFDGIDDYVDLGEQNYEYMTIETVLSNYSGINRTILYNKYNGGYELRLSSSNRMLFSFYLDSASTLKSLNSTFTKSTDKIYYAVTFDGEYAKSYLNGILISSQPISGKIYSDNTNNNHLLLGTGKNGNSLRYLYKGNIYSTRIYSKALTEEEIINNYLVDTKRYNITNQKLTSNSSFGTVTSESGENPYQVFDGDFNTAWESESLDESYIEYQMYNQKTLLGFKIYGYDINKYPKEVELLASKDGITYNSILSKSLEQKGINEYNEIKISNDIYDSYKYLKWKFKNSNNTISIGEIELILNDTIRKEVNSSSISVSGSITSTTNSVIYNDENANLNIKEGILKLDKSGYYNVITNLGNLETGDNTKLYANQNNNSAIYNDETGSVDINSSYIYGYKYGIWNNSINDSTINVNEIVAINSGIYNENLGNMNINVENLTSNKYGIYNLDSGNINVNATKLISNSSNSYGIYNQGSGNIDATIPTLTLSSGTSYALYNNSTGNVILKNSNMTSTGYGIYNKDSGEINLISSKITLKTTNSPASNYGIYNNSTGNISLNSTNILISGTLNSSYNYYGIYENASSNLNLMKSNITGYQYGIYNNADTPINLQSGTISATNTGIYNNSNGQIDIDIIDGVVPKISGTTYGIYNFKGTLNLNNGEISSDGTGIYSSNRTINSADININGGTINGNIGIQNDCNNLNINGGTINGKNIGVLSNGDVNKGTFNMTGGIITSSLSKGTGLSLDNYTANITGGTIKVSGTNSNAIVLNRNLNLSDASISSTSGNGIYLNTSIGNLNMYSGSIEADTGIYAYNGTANISGGTIKGNNFGIKNGDKYISTINLGVKDQIVDKTSPKIISNMYGIYNGGDLQLNYYDGVITGVKDYLINAPIFDYEDNYDIYMKDNNENTLLTDMTLEIPSIEKFGAVAQVDGINYPSVKSAFDSIPETEKKEIKLLKTIKTVVNLGESNKDISINTNGNYIDYISDETYIINRNNLKIYDGDENNSCAGIVTNYATIIDNYGILNTQSYFSNYLYLQSTSNDSKYVVINHTDSEANINSGVSSYFSKYSIDNSGSLNLNNSKIYGMINNKDGNIVSEESKIYSNNSYSIYNESGIINISDTTINNDCSSGTALYNKAGNVTFVNSTINTTQEKSKGIYNKDTLLIESGEISAIANVIVNEGIFTMNSGTLSSHSKRGTALETENDGTTNIYGGIITTSDFDSSIAITSWGTTNIYGGEIYSKGSNSIAVNDFGVVNLGTKGDLDSEGNLIVSVNNPIIESSLVGINNDDNIFNFYDGIIKAVTAINGPVNDIEDGYNIVRDANSDGSETKYLERKFIIKNLTTNEKYQSLSDAIDNASNGDTLQYIESSNLIPSTKTVEITPDKDITIDINGNNISASNELFIKNNGNLKIIDSINTKNEDESINYGTGKLETTGSSLIENTGTLEIDSVIIDGNRNIGNIISNNESGNLIIKNSKFNINIRGNSHDLSLGTNQRDNFNGIYNNSDGDIIISNSKFSNSSTDGFATGYSIYNGLGKIIINNSNFEGESRVPIYNDNSAEIDINNSNILYDFVNNSSRDINLVDCSFAMLSNKSSGNVNINGGSLNYVNYDTYGNNTVIYNGSTGNINIDDLSINTSGNKIKSIYNESTGNINIKSGSIINSDNSLDNIYNESTGTINIGESNENGSNNLITIQGGINNKSTGIINIYYGNITSSINNKSTGTINIGESNENSSNNLITINGSINNELDGIINMYYGTINNTILHNVNGTVNIYDGNITSNEDDYYIDNRGILELYGGNIISIINSGTSNIRNSIISGSVTNTGEINMYSGSITSTSSTGLFNNDNGIVNLYGGTIESTYSTGISSYSIINIGIKGDTDESGNLIVSKELPIIKGKNSGISINNRGSVNFYDGKIIGKKSIDGVLNDIEENYDIFTTTDLDNNEVSYLEKIPVVKNLTTNQEYYDLQTAIDQSANGDTIQFIRDKSFVKSSETIEISSSKNIIIDINGKLIEGNNAKMINNNGILKIIDTLGNGKLLNNNSILINNDGTLGITNSNLSSKGDSTIYNNGTLNINSGTINGDNIAINNYGESNVNTTTITGKNGISNIGSSAITNINDINIQVQNTGIYNSGMGVINFNSGTINVSASSGSGFKVTAGGGTININGGTIISEGYAVYNTSSVSKINIGSNDGMVSTSIPLLHGKNYGVYNEGIVNFYDGIIKGENGAISGTISEVAPGYKIVTSIQDEITSATLSIIADDERVAMVNGINFTDLQTAINSVKDNTESNIVIYKDIELTEDIIVPENKIINLYLNGHTITYGDYSFVKNGTLTILDSAPSDSIGASIINTIEKVLNINQNGKNIIVYEMSDGSKLSTENTYNLYKKVDNEYKLLNMEKDEEVGRYITGSNNSEMTSIKGRIYLNNLEEGSYKLVSNDNKDIEFTITEDGKLNGNILENTNEKRKAIETAFAYLIITIQTGVNQIKYIIYIVAIVSIILGLYFAFKEQKKLSRKV